MRRWLGSLLVACWGGFLVAEAQIVRVGPYGGVRVRAPFTSVDVLPYGGGTRVRAPFTAVDTGLYQYGVGVPYYYAGRPRVYHYSVPVYPVYPVQPVVPVPVYPVPVYPEIVYPEPAPAYVTPPPRAAERPIVGLLEDRLRAAAVRLQYSLSLRRNDGDVWQNYLAPQSIVDTIDEGTDPRALRELVRNYNGVVANPSLSAIRNAAGFSETRQLLRQFVERPPIVQPAPPASEVAPQPAPVAPQPAEELPPPAGDEVPLPPQTENKSTPAAEVARPAKPVPL